MATDTHFVSVHELEKLVHSLHDRVTALEKALSEPEQVISEEPPAPPAA